MDTLKYTSKLKTLYHRLPLPVWILIGVVVVIIISYALIYGIPKKVAFSYAGDTCARQLLLFPGSQLAKSDTFDVSIKDELKIGDFSYASTKVCLAPKHAPATGEFKASIGLLGGWFANKQFAIQVAEPPQARTSDIVGKMISPALPLQVNLSSPDTIHSYEMTIADKQTDCTAKASLVSCDIAQLELSPGSEYTAALYRSFNESNKTKVLEGKVETLLPVKMESASLAEGQTIYDMPKEFSFSFDKPIEKANVIVERKNGETKEKVEAKARFENKTVFVTLSADLARKSEYNLTIQQVIADNGSSLDAPVSINFSTSGGPKPASVSVAATGVPQSAQIIVTLDQPIKEGTDIAKVARVEGVNGSVAQRSPTELVYSIQGGLCVAFSLVLDKGIESGSNKEVSEAWKFDARTICGTSSIIGYSSKGRAITAYYFGNGGTTILFTGGIHGTEGSSFTTMQAWVTYLMSNGYKIPADKRVVIVPNVNPDGIASGTRNSATNVNLGRNFPTANWKADIETANGILVNGGGTSAGSEPETKALMSLTSQVNPRLEVSFHSQGRLVGANKFGDSVLIGNTYAGLVGYQTMFYDAEAVMGYPMTGEYEDWMGESMGTPAILIELPSHSGNYLSSQLNALMRMLTI